MPKNTQNFIIFFIFYEFSKINIIYQLYTLILSQKYRFYIRHNKIAYGIEQIRRHSKHLFFPLKFTKNTKFTYITLQKLFIYFFENLDYLIISYNYDMSAYWIIHFDIIGLILLRILIAKKKTWLEINGTCDDQNFQKIEFQHNKNALISWQLLDIPINAMNSEW